MAGRVFEVTNVPFAAGACTLFSPPRNGFLDCVAGTACGAGAGAIGTAFAIGALGVYVPASRVCT